MSSLTIAAVMFGCVLLSTLFGAWAARRLPEHHLTGESKDVIKLGLGIIATLTALVLGLLVAATKATYDTQSGIVKDMAAQLALLDRVLARYGPGAQDARAQLREVTQVVLHQVWPADTAAPVNFGG